MENTTEARVLALANENNKLLCNAFTQIHFAPEEGSIRAEDFDTIYLVKIEGEEVRVKLFDFTRLYFEQIGTMITWPATGLDADNWKMQWLRKYPSTVFYTKMAVYCYERVSRRKIL